MVARRVYLICFLLVLFFQISNAQQKTEYRLIFGADISKLYNNTSAPVNLIENKNKTGYLVRFELSRLIKEQLRFILAVGYIRLGGNELLDKGYTQSDPDLAPYYPAYNVVREKKYIKLNYLTVSPGLQYALDNITGGVFLNTLFFSDASIKRKFYVTNQSANYSQIYWEHGKTVKDVKKVIMAPEIFLECRVTREVGLRVSYMHAISRTYKTDIEYHQAVTAALAIHL